MSTIVAERIRLRMEELGKNPSGLALEAGLGRSAVRDILSGKARNPQFSTLLSLSVPLECSVAYLMGEIDKPYKEGGNNRYSDFDAQPAEVRAILETGVYRQRGPAADAFSFPVKPPYGTYERFLAYKDLRLPEHNVTLYEMGDNSLDGLGILKGDILTVAYHILDDAIALRDGMLVVAEYEPSSIPASELSARIVKLNGNQGLLECNSRGQEISPIRFRIEDSPFPNNLLPNSYSTEPDGFVNIQGVIVRVTRALPVVM